VALPLVQPAAMTMDAASPAISVTAQDHDCCPSSAPMQQHSTVSCCTVHHQPAAASASDNPNPTGEVTAASLPASFMAAATVAPPSGGKTGAPPRRPATKLRI
jgi:hypothetical protein